MALGPEVRHAAPREIEGDERLSAAAATRSTAALQALGSRHGASIVPRTDEPFIVELGAEPTLGARFRRPP